MIPELGCFLLILGSLTALLIPVCVVYGYYKKEAYICGLWKPGLCLTFVSLTGALLCLIYAFLTDDFSVAYVAGNSNTKLETIYKLAAVWGSHEGSMLLWIWIIVTWSFIVFCFSKGSNDTFGKNQAIVLAIVGLLCLFVLVTSNPFARILPLVPPEGKDLNPILQDIGMILHPPLLFLGYAGLTFCFGTSIAILLNKDLSKGLIECLRRLTIVTWIFLTAGNLLGSWWAYRELGWGGWWFWDPVENASFIPWLLVSAQLHALLLVRYRENLQKTAVLLGLVAFAMCLLGTFIVRSGVMQSVHAFASDPNRGLFLMIVSLLVLIPGFVIYIVKANQLTLRDRPLEMTDLGAVIAVMLLSAAAACVLLGTIYPMIHEGLKGVVISVGAPYFNSIFAPLTILAAILIGCSQLAGFSLIKWLIALIVAAIPAVYFAYFTSCKDPIMTAGGVFAALWITITALMLLFKRGKKTNLFAFLAHLGIAVCIVGVVGDSQYQQEALVRMDPGSGRELGDVVFVYEKTNKVNQKSFYADEGEIAVLNRADEKEITVLRPQRQTFKNNGTEMTKAGIQQGFFRDLYVSMGNKLSPTEYLVRLTIKPFVSWIWFGGLIMILGALVALLKSRKSRVREDA